MIALFTAALLAQAPAVPPSVKDIEALVNESKLEAAVTGVELRLAAARKANNDDEVARDLVWLMQLKSPLGGYETAVRRLKDEPWPKTGLPHAIVALFYARSLSDYLSMYSWEVGKRERVDTSGQLDLKKWTVEQIRAEAERVYEEVWRDREALGPRAIGTLDRVFLEPNNYPPGVRDTLRDVITYLRVADTVDTRWWSPEASNSVWQLDLKALIAGDVSRSKAINLSDLTVHPLVRACAMLDDLEASHLANQRLEAALFARLRRLIVLHDAFSNEADRALIAAELEARITAASALPSSALARATLATWLGEKDLVRARDVAAAGAKAFPSSVGGQRCLALVAGWEAPSFNLTGMVTDGVGKRSLEVTAKNLNHLWLRAWRVDPTETLMQPGYDITPGWEPMKKLLGKPADATWDVALPATPDLLPHRTQLTPPMTAHGLYVVAASARADFSDNANRVAAVPLFISDLVLSVKRYTDRRGLEVVVRNGATGAAVNDAEVQVLSGDWNAPRSITARAKTSAEGVATLQPTSDRSYSFIIARKKNELTVDPQSINFYEQGSAERERALLYTDRSVYRPNQKLEFKVVAYQGSDAAFTTVAKASVPVTLRDPNGEIVATTTVTTNTYGSASGSFTLPLGRLLGQWRLEARNASTVIRVEEYKRPTFEVAFRPPAGAFKLNAPVAAVADAKYLFGLPVTAGKVKWRVTRTPSFPWWWWWAPPQQPQVIASGASSLKDDGTLTVNFTPAADPKLAREVTYSYQIEADVTDEGGETRSASQAMRLGQVSVQASFQLSQGFVTAGKPASLTVHRTDLNGAPRPGQGSWQLMSLEQPKTAVLPGDDSPEKSPAESAARVLTAGDKLKTRWANDFNLTSTLRRWKDGPQLATGNLTHDASGDAALTTAPLEAGAYRVRYRTVDEFGGEWAMATEFIVADARPLATRVPLIVRAETNSVTVGATARILVASALEGQPVLLELYRAGQVFERHWLVAGRDSSIIERRVTEADRGGFAVVASVVRDWQVVSLSQSIWVPWDDKQLTVEFSTFRDLLRPGAKETFKVSVKGQHGPLEAGAVEVLAYMYDQSLDVFAPHVPPQTSALYPSRNGVPWVSSSQGASSERQLTRNSWYTLPSAPSLYDDRLLVPGGYGIGGVGTRGRGGGGLAFRKMKSEAAPDDPTSGAPPPPPSPVARSSKTGDKADNGTMAAAEPEAAPVAVRSNFAETAFFMPHLIADSTGSVSFEFQVPDSVTSWNVWAHALTRDLKGGSVLKKTRSVKDLMVRPYVPRFLREGDLASLKVVVNNASKDDLSGELLLELTDAETHVSVAKDFGLATAPRAFSVKAGQGATLTYQLTTPRRVGQVDFKVVAKANGLSDGELRPVPVLPSRLHLAQSKFVTLKDKDSRTMTFADLLKNDDATRVTEQLVVTVDAQLFSSVLSSLPYLARYPYECTEQTLNRFLSAGIVSSVFKDHPAVARMAKAMATRSSQFEPFDALDANRKLALEESPWLAESKGGSSDDLINMLDAKVLAAERASAMAKLMKTQQPSGAFSWFPGGPPSPWVTLYVLHGFSRATEFKVEVPQYTVNRAWQYIAEEYRREYLACINTSRHCSPEFITFINYVASAWPDESWLGGALSLTERKQMLAYSFAHWKEHSPMLKGYLALTLQRMDRPKDAKLVFDSVMDSAKSTQDEGTFWQPEDRAWLWYRDTIESHAFALRVLTELAPKDPRRAGLVQWLLLNKKLSHWKSTRATAEVIYSLVKYMQAEHQLGVPEESNITVGDVKKTFNFAPDEYTGRKNQLVIPGDQVDPKTMSSVTVSKTTKGFQFASATWHFSTDTLPAEARGDFFSVTRSYFKRVKQGSQTTLKPIDAAVKVEPGDELEVQLSIRARQAAEYVHLRDPRGAGFEPEAAVSRYKYDLGLVWYEEYRDSGTNFFFEQLPAGEYTLHYRVRASMAGTFRLGPATLDSMYAPEFTGYSAGNVLTVAPGGQ